MPAHRLATIGQLRSLERRGRPSLNRASATAVASNERRFSHDPGVVDRNRTIKLAPTRTQPRQRCAPWRNQQRSSKAAPPRRLSVTELDETALSGRQVTSATRRRRLRRNATWRVTIDPISIFPFVHGHSKRARRGTAFGVADASRVSPPTTRRASTTTGAPERVNLHQNCGVCRRSSTRDARIGQPPSSDDAPQRPFRLNVTSSSSDWRGPSAPSTSATRTLPRAFTRYLAPNGCGRVPARENR